MSNILVHSLTNAVDAIKEGWSLVKGLKFRVFILSLLSGLCFIVLGITYISMLMYPQVAKFIEASGKMRDFHFSYAAVPVATLFTFVLIYMLVNCFIYFIDAMMLMLAVRQSIGLPAKISLVFHECRRVWLKIIALSMLVTILILVTSAFDGLLSDAGAIPRLIKIIIMIGEIYIATAVSTFSLPLMITKPQVTWMTAIKDGIQKMNSNWLTIFFVFILLFPVVGIIGLLTLLIGYIWLLPLVYTTFGIIFRNAYQLQKKSHK